MANTHRTTITIPLELKERMNAVGELINWSAVACRAFEQKLAEVISKKGAKDMKDVVARLRASKQKLDEGRYKEGYERGQKWAKGAAEAEELERLERCRDSVRDYEWDDLFRTDERNSGAVTFWNTIRKADQEWEPREFEAFWGGIAGDDHATLTADGEYLRGFAAGALDVWEEVKDEL